MFAFGVPTFGEKKCLHKSSQKFKHKLKLAFDLFLQRYAKPKPSFFLMKKVTFQFCYKNQLTRFKPLLNNVSEMYIFCNKLCNSVL